jgi:glucan phosphoethanolaminetransferase (alkaline phosphatase superfamily)
LNARPSRWLWYELAAWFFFVFLFLAFYLTHPASVAIAVIAHVVVMGGVLLMQWALRVCIALFADNKRLATVAAALFSSLLITWFLLYYPVVIIGLNSWGQVISWALIASYVSQAGELTEALGYSLTLCVLVLLVGFALLWCAVYAYYRKAAWPEALVERWGRKTTIRHTVLAFVFCAVTVGSLFVAPNIDFREPLSLTFYRRGHVHLAGVITSESVGNYVTQQEHDVARKRYEPVLQAAKPNLILFVVDALRPANMSAYGYARKTTPFIDGFFSKTHQRIDSAWSACAESSCGLASLASSRFVHDMCSHPFSLQEVLQRNGYRTKFILSGDHVNFYGLRELYGKVDYFTDGVSAPSLNDDKHVIEKVKTLAAFDGNPTMFQFHLMSAHPLGTRHNEFKRFLPAASYIAPTFSSSNTEGATNFYDNGVVAADDSIRQIVAVLEEKGFLKNALVVLTADHGEALGEHGQYRHARGLRESVLRVPLMFRSFGYTPELFNANRRATSQIDIAPTILRELKLPVPSSWRGVPLQSASDEQVIHFQQFDEIGLVDARDPKRLWKYWLRTSDAQEFLFDIATDPAEMQNLVEHQDAPKALLNEWRLTVRRTRLAADSR